jgi:DNA-binding NarL/FixJ family response regulator
MRHPQWLRRLPAREARVAELLGLGHSQKQIAFRLGLSQASISRAARNAVRTLDLRSVPELAALFAGHAPDEPANGPRFERLSAAEREVARLVFQGASNAAIARIRGTSERTAANQLQAIYAKLGVHSRVELAVPAGATH